MERATTFRVNLDGDCRCPGSPHQQDWVDLALRTPIAVGAAIYGAMRISGHDRAVLEGHMARIYVHLGIRAWSFVDVDDEGVQSFVPVDASADDWADLVDWWLPWDNGGQAVSEAADRLYSDGILRPFNKPTSTSLQGGPMDGSTSATPATGSQPRKVSKPSLPPESVGSKSEDPASSTG